MDSKPSAVASAMRAHVLSLRRHLLALWELFDRASPREGNVPGLVEHEVVNSLAATAARLARCVTDMDRDRFWWHSDPREADSVPEALWYCADQAENALDYLRVETPTGWTPDEAPPTSRLRDLALKLADARTHRRLLRGDRAPVRVAWDHRRMQRVLSEAAEAALAIKDCYGSLDDALGWDDDDSSSEEET